MEWKYLCSHRKRQPQALLFARRTKKLTGQIFNTIIQVFFCRIFEILLLCSCIDIRIGRSGIMVLGICENDKDMGVSCNMIIVEPLAVSEGCTIICGVTTYKIRILVSLEIERFPLPHLQYH